jgi:predicted phosphodiesterase
MKLRILSDIHLEFADYKVTDLPEDKDTVLILAGDIGIVNKSNLQDRFIPFLSRCNIQFRTVILIAGNHEHYGGNFRTTIPNLRGAIAAANLENVVFLEKETRVVDDVAFIGATLWTDCERSEHADFLFNYMNDSRVIRNGGDSERKFTALDSVRDHDAAKVYIKKAIVEHKAAGRKVVVVTHHGVTAKSIHPEYAGSNMNMFFSSELSKLWIETEPNLIIHGHTHKHMDYYVVDNGDGIHSIPVIANPHGYANTEDAFSSGFEPNLTIDTDTL